MEALLSQIRSEIAAREKEVSTLREEISKLRDAMAIIASTGATQKRVDPSPRAESAAPVLTHPSMAVQVLRENGHPMHVGDIVARIETKFSRQVARTSLTTILFKYAQKEHLFFKEPNNVYGLLEWRNGHVSSSAPQEIKH
jgi:hypothetical protein